MAIIFFYTYAFAKLSFIISTCFKWRKKIQKNRWKTNERPNLSL